MARAPAVIKVDSEPRTGGLGLRQFRMNDVLTEARAVVTQARAEAERLGKEAHRQAELVGAEARQQGYQAGFEQGRQEGYSAGRQGGYEQALAEAREKFELQQRSLIGSCQQIIADVNADRTAWKAAARQDLVELAMAIARRVVHYVGEHERQAVLANLEEAVQLAGARSEVAIVVNPADAEAARLFAKSLIDQREQWENIRVLEQPEVSPGGCRVQWSSGAIDAALETQLDRIEAELKGDRPVAPGARG